jgi:hypothetical protein
LLLIHDPTGGSGPAKEPHEGVNLQPVSLSVDYRPNIANHVANQFLQGRPHRWGVTAAEEVRHKRFFGLESTSRLGDVQGVVNALLELGYEPGGETG